MLIPPLYVPGCSIMTELPEILAAANWAAGAVERGQPGQRIDRLGGGDTAIDHAVDLAMAAGLRSGRTFEVQLRGRDNPPAAHHDRRGALGSHDDVAVASDDDLAVPRIGERALAGRIKQQDGGIRSDVEGCLVRTVTLLRSASLIR